MDDYTNFAISAVAIAPTPPDSGLSLYVLLGEGARFQDPPFNATVWQHDVLPDPTNAEIVRVVTILGDQFILSTRGAEGTAVRLIVPGDLIAATITKKTLDDLRAIPLVVRETPAGALNGVNTTFTLSSVPAPNSEQVFLNGLLQEAHGADYGIVGNVITFIMPLIPGDRVLVTYARS